MDIVRFMIPLASASGPAIIGVVVVAAGLFLSWLLRTETGNDPHEKATPGAEPASAMPAGAEPTAQPTVTSQPSE
jgi:ABC-type uncharacterized transport system permease subunit